MFLIFYIVFMILIYMCCFHGVLNFYVVFFIISDS